jgi:hypothetical protein
MMNKLLQIAAAVENEVCCSFDTLLECPQFESLARKLYRKNASVSEAASELVKLANKLI